MTKTTHLRSGGLKMTALSQRPEDGGENCTGLLEAMSAVAKIS